MRPLPAGVPEGGPEGQPGSPGCHLPRGALVLFDTSELRFGSVLHDPPLPPLLVPDLGDSALWSPRRGAGELVGPGQPEGGPCLWGQAGGLFPRGRGSGPKAPRTPGRGQLLTACGPAAEPLRFQRDFPLGLGATWVTCPADTGG